MEKKFRVWDKGEYIYFTLLEELNRTVDPWIESPLIEIIIEQYTGLKDKNGVEIYEGDILSDTPNSVVKFGVADLINSGGGHGEGTWQEPTIGFYREGYIKEHIYKDSLYEAYGQLPEVIGNIHENPELL